MVIRWSVDMAVGAGLLYSRVIDCIFPSSGLETRRGEYIIYGRIHSVRHWELVCWILISSKFPRKLNSIHTWRPLLYQHGAISVCICACGESACVDLYQWCLCSKWRSRRRERKSGVVMLAIKLAPLKVRHGCTESASGDSRLLSTPVSWNHKII